MESEWNGYEYGYAEITFKTKTGKIMKTVNLSLVNNYSRYNMYESIINDVAKIVKKHLNEKYIVENNSDNILDNLLSYINDNRNFDNYDIKEALGNIDKERIPLDVANPDITENIYDLISEFAEEYELSEEWIDNMSEDIEDLFYKFVDKFEDEIWT